MTKTHHVVIWTVTSVRNRRSGVSPVIPPRACVDDVGNLLVFARRATATAFADRLRRHGLDAIVHAVASTDVADLLAFTHGDRAADATDRVIIVEAQATDADDAAEWASELADRFVAKIAAAYEAR